MAGVRAVSDPSQQEGRAPGHLDVLAVSKARYLEWQARDRVDSDATPVLHALCSCMRWPWAGRRGSRALIRAGAGELVDRVAARIVFVRGRRKHGPTLEEEGEWARGRGAKDGGATAASSSLESAVGGRHGSATREWQRVPGLRAASCDGAEPIEASSAGVVRRPWRTGSLLDAGRRPNPA